MSFTVHYPSRDGLRLEADLLRPKDCRHVVVMVHGITAERTEEGLYSTLAEILSAHGIASLMFDFRAHGGTGGRQEDLTLAGVLNDILASIAFAQEQCGVGDFSLVAASFAGGLAVQAAALNRENVRGVVLLNPRLDYSSWVVNPEYWSGTRLAEASATRLYSEGFLPHDSFHMGIPFVNEVMHLSLIHI